jgi:hypothetical protein
VLQKCAFCTLCEARTRTPSSTTRCGLARFGWATIPCQISLAIPRWIYGIVVGVCSGGPSCDSKEKSYVVHQEMCECRLHLHPHEQGKVLQRTLRGDGEQNGNYLSLRTLRLRELADWQIVLLKFGVKDCAGQVSESGLGAAKSLTLEGMRKNRSELDAALEYLLGEVALGGVGNNRGDSLAVAKFASQFCGGEHSGTGA